MRILQITFFTLFSIRDLNGNICDLFVQERCPFIPGNLVGTIPNLELEKICQKECQDFLTSDALFCRNFTFFPYSDKPTECYLFKSCHSTTPCDNCTSGPKLPDMPNECSIGCRAFENVRCDLNFDNLLDIDEPVFSARECQLLCRQTEDCFKFSWDGNTNICYIFSDCSIIDLCPLCITGPAYPDVTPCTPAISTTTSSPTSQPGGILVLALGGFTEREGNIYYSGSTELFNGEKTCSVHIWDMDEWSDMMVSVIGGINITACGGYDRTRAGVTTNCWRLNTIDWAWEHLTGVLPNAVFNAKSVAFRETMIIIGGVYTNGNMYPWFHEYQPNNDTWIYRKELNLPEGTAYHCAVTIDDDQIFVAGGRHSTVSHDTAYVFNYTAGLWVSLPPMENARHDHTCVLWEHQGQLGVLVAGGQCTGAKCNHAVTGPLVSVEFFNVDKNRWETLYDSFLTKPRYGHGMSVVGGVPMVYGGWFNETQILASGERLEGETWVDVENVLSTGRAYFGYTQIDNDLTTC